MSCFHRRSSSQAAFDAEGWMKAAGYFRGPFSDPEYGMRPDDGFMTRIAPQPIALPALRSAISVR